MEFQKMTEAQKMTNANEFKVIVSNERRLNSGIADMNMTNRSMVDRHVEALEAENKELRAEVELYLIKEQLDMNLRKVAQHG